MSAPSDIRTPSKGGFIAFVILSVAALLTDFASLVLVTTWLRAAEAIGTDGAEVRENKDDTAENAR